MYISLDTRTKKCVVMYLCNNKVKIYFTYRKYMYSPPFKDHIAVASYFMKPSKEMFSMRISLPIFLPKSFMKSTETPAGLPAASFPSKGG